MELGQREGRVLAGAAEGLLAPGVSLLERPRRCWKR